MKLVFPELIGLTYSKLSQRIRVISEQWVNNEMYCPACGSVDLSKFPNNTKLADFFCEHCGEIYELKSKHGSIGKTILDGAYYTALERIMSNKNPNLFVLRYSKNIVMDLIIIPKHFFTPDVLQIRNALLSTARRAGYVGSLIRYDKIPEQGKIPVVQDNTERDKSIVLEEFRRVNSLNVNDMGMRGWLMEILRCADIISSDVFSLRDIYAFSEKLAERHPENLNVQAKIRQQLQLLRDRGFIEFLGRGKYRKLWRAIYNDTRNDFC